MLVAHALPGQNTQGLLVHGVASLKHFVEHPGDCYLFVRRPDGDILDDKGESILSTHTYRPDSYSLDAIGEISEWIVIVPSNGLSGAGFTIFAST